MATERRDIVRPDDAAFVVVLLNRRSHHARHPDTVATHGQDLVTAIFTLNSGVQRPRVFIAQLENVTDFDAALNHQGTLTVRA